MNFILQSLQKKFIQSMMCSPLLIVMCQIESCEKVNCTNRHILLNQVDRKKVYVKIKIGPHNK